MRFDRGRAAVERTVVTEEPDARRSPVTERDNPFEGTPFEKLLQADGKVAFFNVDFSVFTFVHYLEHLTSGMAGVTLYTDETFDVPVVGRHGETLMVRTHAFTREAILRRRFSILERTLRKQGLIREGRLGASRFLLVELNAVVRAVEASATQGVYFYDSAQ